MNAPAPQSVLITGAAGEIGDVLREGLADRYRRLVLFDRKPMIARRPSEEVIVGDLADRDALERAMRGVDCVLHFAGVPREAEWEPILEANIIGLYNTIDAARACGVRRFVFASSNHTIGYHRRERTVDDSTPVRPDGRYGVSKVFGEALGRLYADKHGLSVICLRIGSFRERPQSKRELATWISHGDMVQLAERSIEAPASLHFEIFYGVSANPECRWVDASGEVLGYIPRDAADETMLPPGPAGEREAPGPQNMFHGGPVCAREFTGDVDSID